MVLALWLETLGNHRIQLAEIAAPIITISKQSHQQQMCWPFNICIFSVSSQLNLENVFRSDDFFSFNSKVDWIQSISMDIYVQQQPICCQFMAIKITHPLKSESCKAMQLQRYAYIYYIYCGIASQWQFHSFFVQSICWDTLQLFDVYIAVFYLWHICYMVQ